MVYRFFNFPNIRNYRTLKEFPEMKSRVEKEREFHDRIRKVEGDAHVADTHWSPEIEDTIKNNPLWVNMKYYAIERLSQQKVQDWLKRHCQGKRVLDYCCGNGENSIYMAKNGASSVFGIDISEVSITNCRESAKAEGVEHVTEYMVGDAENTGFDESSFEIIIEYGALHHLDLDKAFQEMLRILRPDGSVICTEALGHNPIIHLYRKLTPNLRTEWEVDHILRKPNFETAHKYFGKVDMHFYHLFTLLAVPFRKTKFFPSLLGFLEKVDSFILKSPFIKWWSWQTVFILSEPKKPAEPNNPQN
jgi:ubiquinone/menaquinone biosynthesis C-methylase UbiE